MALLSLASASVTCVSVIPVPLAIVVEAVGVSGLKLGGLDE